MKRSSEKVNFDEYAANYDALMRQHVSTPFEENNEYFAEYKIKLLRDLVGNSHSDILDYGCGIGRSIPHMQKYFPSARISGFDVSDESVQYAKKKYPASKFYNHTQLKKMKASFDVIFLAGVLHHIAPPERKGVIDELHKLLKPNGNLVIFEHNPYNPVTRKIVNDCPFDADAVLLPQRELKQRLIDGTFRIVSTGYTLFFPSFLNFLRPLEKYLKFLPLGGQQFIHATRG